MKLVIGICTPLQKVEKTHEGLPPMYTNHSLRSPLPGMVHGVTPEARQGHTRVAGIFKLSGLPTKGHQRLLYKHLADCQKSLR